MHVYVVLYGNDHVQIGYNDCPLPVIEYKTSLRNHVKQLIFEIVFDKLCFKFHSIESFTISIGGYYSLYYNKYKEEFHQVLRDCRLSSSLVTCYESIALYPTNSNSGLHVHQRDTDLYELVQLNQGYLIEASHLIVNHTENGKSWEDNLLIALNNISTLTNLVVTSEPGLPPPILVEHAFKFKFTNMNSSNSLYVGCLIMSKVALQLKSTNKSITLLLPQLDF